MYAIQLETTQDTEDPWRVDARCRDGSASLTDLFFSEDIGDIARAKSFCAECPVRESCLEHALGHREKDGVWGGATERERRRIIRQRRRTA